MPSAASGSARRQVSAGGVLSFRNARETLEAAMDRVEAQRLAS